MRTTVRLLAIVLLTGCAANPAPEAPSQPAPAPARAPKNTWQGQLQVSLAYTATVDGRQIAVHVGNRQWVRVFFDDLCIDADHGPFYELRDAATGAVVLPTTWDEVHVVAGRGIYVLPAEERFKRLKKSFSNSEEFVRDVRSNADGLNRWERFGKLDLATGRTSPTDLLVIDEQFGDRRDDPTLPAELREPSYLLVSCPKGRTDHHAEIVGPSGDSLGTYDGYVPPGPTTFTTWMDYAANRDVWLLSNGRFAVITTRQPDGVRHNYLLGRARELIEPLAAEVCAFQGDKATFLGMRAPGTVPSEDLWLLLQPNGVFGTPQGMIGFRPYDYLTDGERSMHIGDGTTRPVHGWFLRHYLPLTGDRQPWGHADPDLTRLHVMSMRDHAIETFEGLHPNARVAYVERDGSGWTGYVLASGKFDFQQEFGKGATLDECQSATRAQIAKELQQYAEYKARKDAEESRQRDAEQLKRDWNEAVRTRNDNEMSRLVTRMGGGDHWYTYAKSARSASPELYERAAGKVTSAAYATELRKLAQDQRDEIERRQEEARTAAVQQVAAPVTSGSSDFTRQATSIRPTLPPMYENPGLYNYRSQAYGGWKAMPWDR